MTGKENKSLFRELENLTTEQRNPKSLNIDTLSTLKILKIINHEDSSVPADVAKEIPYIAKAVELIITALKAGEDCSILAQEPAEE
jgi:N-acetylmuramic acid 6-phosphate etherase